MRLVSIRMPESLLSGLKKLALVESIRRNRLVEWPALLRELAEERLRQENVK